MTVREPLRVALIQTQAENAGAQEISRLLAVGLEARGHQVRQVFFFRRTTSFDDVANAVMCCRTRPSGPLAFLRLLLRLRAVLKENRTEIAVTFQHYGNLIGTPIARASGVKHVVANQNTAPESLNWAMVAADTLYGMLGLYDRVIVNSRESEAIYGSYPRRYARRVVKIDHGFAERSTSLGKTDARVALELPAEVPLLGCAARLHVGKNLGAAIRILAINTEQHLALAGQGTERAALETLAQDLGVRSRVHFLGELDPEKMGCFLAALDSFVFPSAFETFGLAVAEAAQAGVPVVANARPILQDVLAVDGEPCALFVDVEDTVAFAAAVRRILEDRDLAETLSSRGRRLSARFSLDRMIEGYIDVIEALR